MSTLTVHPAGHDPAALRYAMTVHPDCPVEDWRLSVPAAAGTYLLLDEQQQPILLAVTGDLRRTLADRLGERVTADPHADGDPNPPEPSQTSPRTDYRAITRRVLFRPAGSRFEAEWAYVVNARRWLPHRAAEHIEPWRTWWVTLAHLPTDDPGSDVPAAHRFPRFEVRSRPDEKDAVALGPLPTAAAARTLIELLTDLFELCREYDILLQTPDGRACAYKELGRCPAPCDGSVPLRTYYRSLAEAVAFAGGAHERYLDTWRDRMQALAGELKFEQAERLRQQIDRAEKRLAGEPYLALGQLEDQRHLLLQRGQGKWTARAFAVTPGRVDFLGQVQRRHRAEQLHWLAERIGDDLAVPSALDDAGLDLLTFAGWYRLRTQRDPGVWLTPHQARDPDRLQESVDTLWQ